VALTKSILNFYLFQKSNATHTPTSLHPWVAFKITIGLKIHHKSNDGFKSHLRV